VLDYYTFEVLERLRQEQLPVKLETQRLLRRVLAGNKLHRELRRVLACGLSCEDIVRELLVVRQSNPES